MLLKVENLSVEFAGIKALVDANLHVRAGEIVAIIGPNGAGKTTLLNAISGVITPTSGTILLNGRPIQGLRASQVAREGVRRTFQNGGLFGSMTVLENVLVGLHPRFSSRAVSLVSWFGAPAREEREATQEARDLLSAMKMEHRQDALAKELSGGQQRIVEIVRTIAGHPRLLMLDEPAVGLSPAARIQLMEIVRMMVQRDKVGVLLIEHAMDFVMALADRVVVFSSGAKIGEGTPLEIRRDPKVLEAYLGASIHS